MPKIGTGIITTSNRSLNPNIELLAHQDNHIVVYIDKERRGVSYGRNQCIKKLYDKGCDYIFLFDDDCYPMMKGWEQYFIDAHLQSNIHHFTIAEAFKSELLRVDKGIHYYNGAVGCFRFLTRQLVDTIGYFNTQYHKYGFEDAGYTNRALRSGLVPCNAGEYPTPHRSMFYIYSEDVYARDPQVNYTYEEKTAFIEQNRPIYLNEINSSTLYYPFKQND